jgi:hypothetical protein
MLGKSNSGETLSEILDHVRALEFSMHEHVEANLFLPLDGLSNLLLYEFFVFLLC